MDSSDGVRSSLLLLYARADWFGCVVFSLLIQHWTAISITAAHLRDFAFLVFSRLLMILWTMVGMIMRHVITELWGWPLITVEKMPIMRSLRTSEISAHTPSSHLSIDARVFSLLVSRSTWTWLHHWCGIEGESRIAEKCHWCLLPITINLINRFALCAAAVAAAAWSIPTINLNKCFAIFALTYHFQMEMKQPKNK